MDINSIILAVTETVQQEASSGVLGTLGINWKLFLAQLVNFAIVLFVFWKWIVKPLGEKLTQRQARIESGLKQAELNQLERQRFEEWKLAEMKKARVEADHVLRTATDTANKVKQETIVETQKQADKLLNCAQKCIDAEGSKMLIEVKSELATLVVLASEKIIKAKLDPRKDHELINEAIKQAK